MVGFQLWCPQGWDGVLIGAHRTDTGLNVETVEVAGQVSQLPLGPYVELQKSDPVQLAPLIEGTFAALESKSVRQINPFQFLEIGFQSAVRHYRTGDLLWIVGLDGLLGAEKRDVFKARLGRW